MRHLLRPAASIACLIGLWFVRRFLRRQRKDDRAATIKIDGHQETFEQYMARHEREFRVRAHARNVEERRVCHQLAPIVGGIAAVYGFISEQSVSSRAEIAAIYFALGYLAIWATWLFDWVLRPTALNATQYSLWARHYVEAAQQQSRGGQEAQH